MAWITSSAALPTVLHEASFWLFAPSTVRSPGVSGAPSKMMASSSWATVIAASDTAEAENGSPFCS